MFDFLGRFHPVLVHLPIGILILAFVLLLASRRSSSPGMEKAISISLLFGLIVAILSAITGFSLSQSDEYDASLVSWHQWMAIGLAIVTAVLYFLRRRNLEKHWQLLLGAVMLVLIFITGHLGGSLTHGSDYLWKGLASDSTESVGPYKNLPNVQEAYAYTDIIQPLLQNKCYGCHGPRKQKGKLRLDQPDLIMKGGKDGKAIVPSNPDEGEMMHRLELPREDEDHMPPKEKSQLKESDIAIIHWWIQHGASFDKKVKDIPQDQKIKETLTALENRKADEGLVTDLPAETVENAGESAIQMLKDRGIVVLPLAVNTNYLMVNFISADSITDKDLALLLPIKKQLLWLRLSDKPITDEGMKTVAQLNNLVRLFLDQTNITDKGLAELKTLSNLKYLNLSGTKITARGLFSLKELKNLKSIYLFQSTVDKNDWAELKKNFPNTIIDSGGYVVPTLVTDTQEVKPPKR